MPKTALITGITGQDGSYLAEFLLGQGYRVVGMTRRSSTLGDERIAHLGDQIELIQGDLLDQASLVEALARARARRGLQPRGPELRPDVLEPAGADRRVHRARRDADARGDPPGRPGASASTRPRRARCSARSGRRRRPRRRRSTRAARTASPRSMAHCITVNYRESYGIFACSGILFNHESPRRGLEFVTRKITDGVARIKLGLDRRAAAGQSRREARLGFRRRLRRGHVADAPAGRSRTTTSSPPA